MDFYLTVPPCIDKKLESYVPSAHRVLLLALDLAVALFLDEEDKAITQKTEKHVETEKKRQASREITCLLSEIYAVGCSVLEALSLDSTVTGLVSDAGQILCHRLIWCSRRILCYL